jgi:hypothetical protein
MGERRRRFLVVDDAALDVQTASDGMSTRWMFENGFSRSSTGISMRPRSGSN